MVSCFSANLGSTVGISTLCYPCDDGKAPALAVLGAWEKRTMPGLLQKLRVHKRSGIWCPESLRVISVWHNEDTEKLHTHSHMRTHTRLGLT